MEKEVSKEIDLNIRIKNWLNGYVGNIIFNDYRIYNYLKYV